MYVQPPDRIELCVRDRDGQPCLGVIYRPWSNMPYCPKCGSKDPGLTYVREDTRGPGR